MVCPSRDDGQSNEVSVAAKQARTPLLEAHDANVEQQEKRVQYLVPRQSGCRKAFKEFNKEADNNRACFVRFEDKRALMNMRAF